MLVKPVTLEGEALVRVKRIQRAPLEQAGLLQPLNAPTADRRWMLAKDYIYIWFKDDYRFKILIPCGDENDGVSAPRFAWSLANIRPDGLLRAAALVHDWFYKWKGAVPLYWYKEPDSTEWVALRRVFTRREADDIFLELAELAGVGWIKRMVAYRALRLFGWHAWSQQDTEPV